MAAPKEIIERVEKIYRYPTLADLHGQVKTMAEAVVEIDRHHRRLEENISALAGRVERLTTLVDALVSRLP